MTSLPTLWLIPARGGSKGIPGKNVKPFCGKPLVARAVEQALQCAAPRDTVFVSTDSDEIRLAAEKVAPVVPFMRPPHLASDTATTHDAIIHALDAFALRGQQFSRVVLLQPTSPLRTTAHIKGAAALWTPDLDMVVGVKETAANPYYNAFEADADGFLHISKGPGTYTRRQDAPKVWEYNGAVYVMNVRSLRRSPMQRWTRIVPYPMPASASVDLDTPTDWIVAETLMQHADR